METKTTRYEAGLAKAIRDKIQVSAREQEDT
jgi:hypothetical protein